MTGAEIAECLDIAVTTVSGLLSRIGMGKQGRLGMEPAVRYERSRPGELIHIDVKKLGRIARPGHRVLGRRSAGGHHRRIYDRGWEFVHVCLDDATRLAYLEVLDDEKAVTAIAFLRRAVAFYAAHGITVERLLTDNGSAYRSGQRRPRPTTSPLTLRQESEICRGLGVARCARHHYEDDARRSDLCEMRHR